MLGKTIENIPIDVIRHNDKYCYIVEGHGGKAVHTWPIYHFYYTYIHISKEKAIKDYECWYVDQYKKYRFMGKEKGGMLEGSLDRLVKQKMYYGEPPEKSIRQAISERVEHRYKLADSIVHNGYISYHNGPVEGIRKNNTIVLICGHHRIAVLTALGKDVIPDVNVYSNTYSYHAHRLIKRIKSLFL